MDTLPDESMLHGSPSSLNNVSLTISQDGNHCFYPSRNAIVRVTFKGGSAPSYSHYNLPKIATHNPPNQNIRTNMKKEAFFNLKARGAMVFLSYYLPPTAYDHFEQQQSSSYKRFVCRKYYNFAWGVFLLHEKDPPSLLFRKIVHTGGNLLAVHRSMGWQPMRIEKFPKWELDTVELSPEKNAIFHRDPSSINTNVFYGFQVTHE